MPYGYQAYHYHDNTLPNVNPSLNKEKTAQDAHIEDIRKHYEMMWLYHKTRELATKGSGFQVSHEWLLTMIQAAGNSQNVHNSPTRNIKRPTGYFISACNTYHSGISLRGVFYPIKLEVLMKLTHKCDPESLAAGQNVEDIRKMKSQILDESIRYLIDVVCTMIGQGDAYLRVVRAPTQIFTEETRRKMKLPPNWNRSLIEEKDCIEIYLPAEEKCKDSWYCRAIKEHGKRDKIKITHEELKDFLKMARSTFGPFRIRMSDSATKAYLLMYLEI